MLWESSWHKILKSGHVTVCYIAFDKQYKCSESVVKAFRCAPLHLIPYPHHNTPSAHFLISPSPQNKYFSFFSWNQHKHKLKCFHARLFSIISSFFPSSHRIITHFHLFYSQDNCNCLWNILVWSCCRWKNEVG